MDSFFWFIHFVKTFSHNISSLIHSKSNATHLSVNAESIYSFQLCVFNEGIHPLLHLIRFKVHPFVQHSPIHPFIVSNAERNQHSGKMAKLTFLKLLSDIESLWERTCSQCNFANKLLTLKSFECYVSLAEIPFNSIISVANWQHFGIQVNMQKGFHFSLRDKARSLLFENIHIGIHINICSNNIWNLNAKEVSTQFKW